MAATLSDFGDRTLVLTLLRGLSDKFWPMVTNLKMRQPFPTFKEARTLLLLEEIDIDDIAAGNDAPPPPASSALVAAPRTPSGGSGQGHNSGHDGHSRGSS